MCQALNIVPLVRRSVRLTMRLRLMNVRTNLISLCFCLLALWMARVGRLSGEGAAVDVDKFLSVGGGDLFLMSLLMNDSLDDDEDFTRDLPLNMSDDEVKVCCLLIKRRGLNMTIGSRLAKHYTINISVLIKVLICGCRGRHCRISMTLRRCVKNTTRSALGQVRVLQWHLCMAR
jgi:hypothetical protein